MVVAYGGLYLIGLVDPMANQKIMVDFLLMKWTSDNGGFSMPVVELNIFRYHLTIKVK